MTSKRIFFFLTIFLSVSSFTQEKLPAISATHLTCEYLIDPLGLDVLYPRLGWRLKSNDSKAKGGGQTAYQILVASTVSKLKEGEADLWNSGKISSSATAQIHYQGKELNSGQQCFWTVKIWDKKNQPGSWTSVAHWTMGLLKASDWKAKWIGDQPDLVQKKYRDYLDQYDEKKDGPLSNKHPIPPSSPMIRKSFEVRDDIERADLFVSALGYYEMNLNGKKIGDQVLAPEWTDFNKRVQYQTYDLRKILKKGKNVLSALLGDGWYLGMIGPTKWHQDYPLRGVYGNDRRLIAQLEIRYKDGSTQLIKTDETWKINNNGFILSADNFLGQKIDAGLIPEGWQTTAYNDQSWKSVYVDYSVQKNLEAQKNEPVRIYKELKAQQVTMRGDTAIVDFGQNLTGWTRLQIKGLKGTMLRIRHGEMLADNGSLYTQNLAAALQEDYYILSGKQDEFEPHFTYHGFRFVEISGYKGPITANMIVAKAISSDPVQTGSFSCSNPKINQLFSNILWTQRNNMTSIPTDCPQRDERMGWMGDAQVFCQNSIFNMNMAAFYTKWIKDIRDAQSERGTFPDIAPHANKPDIRFSNAPAWSDAGVIVPWRLYENYGDVEVLRQHYEAMKKYIENIRKQNPDGLWLNDVGNQYGDWLNANTVIAEGYSNKRGEVPKPVFATAFYANSVRLFSKVAGVLGNSADANAYQKLYDTIAKKFNESYVDQDARIQGNTQSAYAIALNFELLPKEKEAQAFDHMVECLKEYDNRISTGFISTLMLMKELTKRGRNDLAYALLTSERFPSWLYSINQGATTIWERWDAYVKGRGFQDAGMNSFCHYSIGSVGEWMYRVILGINPDPLNPGFSRFIIAPQPGGGLTWANGSYESIHGRIGVQWKLEGTKFRMQVEIPINTNATLKLPRKGKVLVDGKEVKATNEIELGSGVYWVEVL